MKLILILISHAEITDVKGDNAHEIYKWAKENYGKSAVLNGIFIKY